MRRSIVPIIAFALVVVTACSCSVIQSAKPTARTKSSAVARQETSPAPIADLPVWRRTDRVALCTQLGWWDVTHGNVAKPRIALTFDAGGDAGATATILDELKAAGLHCTFFVTGQFASDHPDLVRRMAAEGHEVGNHSDTHPKFTTLSEQQARSQIEVADARISALTGMSTKPYFRFPYGLKSNDLIRLVNSMGYLSASWTIDDGDWETGITPDKVHGNAVSHTGPGAIILMHCGSLVEGQVLPRTIVDIRARGLSIVTLTECLMPGNEVPARSSPGKPVESVPEHASSSGQP
jgi:peptidoglycan/xylan/chitin deacetylase (PgdA/CDA1 family)